MWYELLNFGSIVFILISSAFFIALLAEVVYEKFAWALFTVLAYALLFFGFTKVEWGWIVEHKQYLWMAGVGYLVGAIITSFVKWYFLLVDARDRYDNYKIEFLAQNGVNTYEPIPENLLNDWSIYITRKYSYSSSYTSGQKVVISDIIPSAKNNKNKIIGWMAYWPIVIFWSMFHDVFRRIWETIYRLSIRIYNGFANLVFRGVAAEIEAANAANDTARKQQDKKTGFIKHGASSNSDANLEL